jgi:hypothetical protein
MTAPSTADLAKLIETLTTMVASLQMSVAELQKEKSSASSGVPGGHDGQHHHDSRSWTSPATTEKLIR